MAKVWLSLMLVGHAAASLLTVPKSSISVSLGDTALLPASLNFSALVPEYFQMRWHFLTGPNVKLILIVIADNCQADNATWYWKNSCNINIWKTAGYENRVELSSEDASLILWDTRAEDSGIYSITFLALGAKLSDNINLTVSNGTNSNDYNVIPDIQFPGDDQQIQAGKADVDVPMSLVKVTNEGDYRMSNIIRLSLSGLTLGLLALIVSKHTSFTYCTAKRTASRGGRETILYQATAKSTVTSRLDSNPLYVEMSGSDEL